MPRPSSSSTSVRTGSLAWRLAVALAAIVLTLGLVSMACLWSIIDIHHRLHSVKDEEVKARTIVRLASAVRDQYAHVAHTIILGNDSHVRFFRDACESLGRIAEKVRTDAVGTENKETALRILRASDEIARLFDQEVLPEVANGRRDKLVATHERILELAMRAEEDAEGLGSRAEASMEDLGRHVRATQHGAILMTILAHIVALSTAVLVGIYLYRSIARPIRLLSAGALRVGGGDLQTKIAVESTDELGLLARQFNEMTRSLKEHQARFIQAEKLAGLGRLAANVAHELNNPIAVISGYAKLLMRRADGTEVDPRMLAAIDEEAERCRRVIEGLLQLTRGGGIELRPVDLRSLIEEVVARLRIGGLAPGIDVCISGDASAMGDAVKLAQVVTNLVANASESCGPQGRIEIGVATVTSESIEISVHDNGSGVKAEHREQIFEPLFTTKANGTGLGLAISRAIMRAHGGDLVLGLDAPGGATFLLTLPRARDSKS